MKRALRSSTFAAALRCLIWAGVVLCAIGLYAQQTQTTDNPQTITGSGKRGYIAAWNSPTQLVDSIIFQNNGLIGVGTIHPSTNFDVAGGINSSTGYNLGGQSFAFGSLSSGNVFLGFAGNGTMTGGANTAIGVAAFQNNVSGVENTAVGWESLLKSVQSWNTAVGYEALASIEGAFNTAAGYSAGSNLAANNNRTSVGHFALLLAGGDSLTCIGSACNTSTSSLTNATAIGYEAYVEQSNSLVLGCTQGKGRPFPCAISPNVGIATTSPGNIFTIGQGAGHAIADGWDTYSSRRFKTNIETLHGALHKVEQLRGVSYQQKGSGKHEVGVIAEEVAAVVPEVISREKSGKDAQGVDYSRLTTLLIEATKEQQALIHQEEALIQQLQAQNRARQAQIARLSSQAKAIQSSLKDGAEADSAIRGVNEERPFVRQ